MTLYEVLGVPADATADEVAAAYRRLAADCHPAIDDSPEAEARFHELTSAYRVLVDPAKRRDYDTFLSVEGIDPESIPARRPPADSADRGEPEPAAAVPPVVFLEGVPEVAPPDQPADRVERHARRRRNRLIAVGVVAALAVVAVIVWLVAGSGEGQLADDSVSPPPIEGRSNLLAFSVDADPPFAAIVGTGGGRPPVVVAVPYNLLTPQGSGGGSVGQAFAESAATGRTVVSNVAGAWIPNYAQVGLSDLADVVDQRGGIELDLPLALSVGRNVIGPGPTQMRGKQVVAYLNDATGAERTLRWEEVLQALFAESVPLPDDAETNDFDAATSALKAAQGASVAELPTAAAEGPYRRVDNALMATGVHDLFGIGDERRTNVVIFLGVDRPKLAETATEALIPRGFHVAAYSQTKGLERHGRPSKDTVIYYYGDDLVDEAERIREALGVGKVVLSELGSGVADISVQLGKDYAAGFGG